MNDECDDDAPLYGIETSSSPLSSNADTNSRDAKTSSTAEATETTESSDEWSPDESKQGTVSLRTYAAYVSAAGGIVAVVAVLIASVVAEGAKGFSIWWLAYWIEEGSGTINVSENASLIAALYRAWCTL